VKCRKHHDETCESINMRCYGCREMGHKISTCPKVAWNQNKPTPVNQLRPPAYAPRGRPPAPRAGQRTRNDKKQQAGGRVYCLEAEEEEEEEGRDPHIVVSSTFSVNTLPTTVLFDAGATHSFISLAITKQLACAFEELDVQLCVSTPIGSLYQPQ